MAEIEVTLDIEDRETSTAVYSTDDGTTFVDIEDSRGAVVRLRCSSREFVPEWADTVKRRAFVGVPS